MSVPIQISSRNIQGYKSKNIGNKLKDVDFLNEIKNYSIVGIVETHIHKEIEEELCIPGFRLLSHKSRSLNNKSHKSSGGIALFIKESLWNLVIPINNDDNHNSLWVKLKKEASGGQDDIYIGTIYFSPLKNNNDNSKKGYDIFEEILHYKEKGEVIIQGDFNARTNVEDDTIIPDKFDNSLNLTVSNNIPCRNSEDKMPPDHRGKEILELCKSLGLVIVNGCKTCDIYGKYKSFQWNGSSVVDYVITSQKMFENIEYLNVGNYIPWLSDHCALQYKLGISILKSQHNVSKELGETYNSFYWNEGSSKKFKEGLKKMQQ